MKTAKEYRSLALETLRGNWKSYVLATLVLTLPIALYEIYTLGMSVMQKEPNIYVLLLLYALLLFLSFPLVYAFQNGCLQKFRKDEGTLLKLMLGIFKCEYLRGLRAYLRVLVLSTLYTLCLSIPTALVTVFFCKFVLGIPFSTLAEPESLNIFMVVMVLTLYVFMIPVFIWTYAVSLTPYLTYDRKELSISACMKESKRLMKGHKWQLFCLQLSFIGWGLLALLTLGIGVLWLLPYQHLSIAAFYEDVLKENATAECSCAAPTQE